MVKPSHTLLILCLLCLQLISSCREKHTHIGETEIVEKPEEINVRAEDIIQGTLKDLLDKDPELSDSFRIRNAAILQQLYARNEYQPLWSDSGQFRPWSDSLMRFVDSSLYYGLFPEDYDVVKITALRKELSVDTATQVKLDAAQWAYADLLLSGAFVQVVKDLARGRLAHDTLINKDTIFTTAFFEKELQFLKDSSLSSFAALLEPSHRQYGELKKVLADLLPTADLKAYTLVRTKDSAKLPALVYQRLTEEDSLILDPVADPDSLQVASAVKKYLKRKKIKGDGSVTASLVKRLNNTDREKLLRIAINMDRYKSLPPMPMQYVWVNIPSYSLQLSDSDSVVLRSRVVVGKAITKTPVLSSVITDMITYPKWHIPESIIRNDILPGLKRDPGYTRRKGYSLIDKEGNEVDPYSVRWSKFKEGIPYKVVQGSGDDNALGVMKFNFPNKHSVYLHDTNQRHLFSKSSRALSHGCVRVQAWQELAHYFLRNDSLHTGRALPVDTLQQWLGRKEKHVVPVRKRVPLFIRYFTLEVQEGELLVYDDIYGEDGRMRDLFFSEK